MKTRMLFLVALCAAIIASGCDNPTQEVPVSSAKEITAFTFAGITSETSINEFMHIISITVPYGTDTENLTPTITHTGSHISPESGNPTNFSSPVIYTVQAQDGSKQDYNTTVSIAPNPANSITSFTLSTPAVTGVIDHSSHTIVLNVPEDTDITGITPTIIHTGVSITPDSGVTLDFSNPAIYTVTALDGSTQEYIVSVSSSSMRPVIYPPSNKTYQISVEVTLSCETEGASIYYTTTGSTPTKFSTLYSGPFTLSAYSSSSITVKTVKAIAIKDSVSSAVESITYSLVPNVRPVAETGRNIKGLVNTPITLDGSKSHDVNETPLSYEWSLLTAPPGSTATITDANLEQASIIPDKPGPYTITLTVDDGRYSDSDSLVVYANFGYSVLGFNVVDAEYSSALNAVVMASTLPVPALKVYNTETGTIDSVTLPYTPKAVSIGPDGVTAAVGYSGGNSSQSTPNYVSIINLSPTPSITSTILFDDSLSCANDIHDLVLTGSHVYSISAVSNNYFRSINLGSHYQTRIDRSYQNPGYIRYSPLQNSVLFVSNNSLRSNYSHFKPTDNGEDFSLLKTISIYIESRKFWINDDGSQFINSFGQVYSISDDPAQDMEHLGTIGNPADRVKYVACDILPDGETIAAIKQPDSFYPATKNDDTKVLIFDASSYEEKHALELPTFTDASADHLGHACFMVHDPTYSRSIIIVKSDATYGSIEEFAIVIY